MEVLHRLPADVADYVVSFIPTLQQSMLHTLLRSIHEKDVLSGYNLLSIKFVESDATHDVYRIQCQDMSGNNDYEWDAILVPYSMCEAYLVNANNNLRQWGIEHNVHMNRLMIDEDGFDCLLIDDWHHTNFYVVIS